MSKHRPKPASAAKPAPRPKSRLPTTYWLNLLRTGPNGVRKWDRLTAAERAKVRLAGADLSGCNLSGVNLQGVRAGKASFAGSVLSGARLTGGWFADANFSGAKLDQARLQGGRFRGASFAGADLTGALLDEADLRGADLTGASLFHAYVTGARFDTRTRWPADVVIPPDMAKLGRVYDPLLEFAPPGQKTVVPDIGRLMKRLQEAIDPKRMKRTLDMLKAGKNQLFAEIEPTLVRGIVRSQTEEDLVYSCVLTQDGVYACCTPDLLPCLGLRGEPCKHLLVLLIGLARAGQLDATTIDKWVMAAAGKNHKWNKTTQNHVSDTLLKYKGVQAGEIDWRPTETIPEDFYAM